MKLTVSNANITNTFSTARMTLANTNVVESITLGNVSVTPSQITVGSATITPTAVTVPALVLGGFQFTGGQQGGIINYQEFTANGTWYNPYANASVNASLTGYEQVLVMAWGGGGGGASNNTIARGGGGGACVIGNFLLSNLSNTVSVTVGLGGAGSRTTTTAIAASGDGANSIFGSLVAQGGGRVNTTGGGGAGLYNGGSFDGSGGDPLGGSVPSGTSTFGGGGTGNASNTVGGSSIYGGGGAGVGGNGGFSVFGGGGGAAANSNQTMVGGTSVFGGAGGAANTTGAFAGSIPGGGGGATNAAANTGARGEVRVWVFGPAGTTAGAPTYALTANTTTLYEGSSVLYTVSTTNIANGTSLYYTLNNSSTAVATDFTTAVNGSVIINGGTGTFTLTANNDTDSVNEAFQIDVRTDSTTGSIVASNGNVSIVPGTELLYSTTVIDTTTASGVFSFNNVPLTTASSDREILITAMLLSDPANPISGTISSISMDGVTTNLSTTSTTSLSSAITGSSVLSKPTGTTANISVTSTPTSAGYTACLISVYGLYGRSSTANNRAVDSAFFGGQNANTTTTTVDMSIGDVVVAAIKYPGGNTTNISTSFPGYIEDYDAGFQSNNKIAFYHINAAASASSSTHTFSGAVASEYNLGGVWVYSK